MRLILPWEGSTSARNVTDKLILPWECYTWWMLPRELHKVNTCMRSSCKLIIFRSILWSLAYRITDRYWSRCVLSLVRERCLRFCFLFFYWATTIIKLIICVASGACWLCSCCSNPPNSDMDYRTFNVRSDVNACDCTRGCGDTERDGESEDCTWLHCHHHNQSALGWAMAWTALNVSFTVRGKVSYSVHKAELLKRVS